jgi:hypothetical protein
MEIHWCKVAVPTCPPKDEIYSLAARATGFNLAYINLYYFFRMSREFSSIKYPKLQTGNPTDISGNILGTKINGLVQGDSSHTIAV